MIVLLATVSFNAQTNNPYPGNPPYTFSISEDPIPDQQFFAVSPLESDSLRYVFRSKTKLYAYSHYGNKMWEVSINNPGSIAGHCGSKEGAADVDGDGKIEVTALDSGNHVFIYNGLDGDLERTITVSNLGSNQILGFIAIVNLRGEGDHDAIVQTIDTTQQGSGIGYYINRTLVAINLEDGSELWRVEQDNDPNNPVLRPDGIYEGYWGQAHSGLMCADVDGDGRDEVIGGNIIDDNGTVIDLGYTKKWIGETQNAKYIDHLDCIAVGDFRPDLPGLEWVTTEEDHCPGPVYNNYWHTTMLHYDPNNPHQGILWTREVHELFSKEPDREPQNVAVGNFDTTRAYSEVWNRSRSNGNDTHDQGVGQHPWVYAADTSLIAHYGTDTKLPAGFNKHANGNAEGVEIIWTIDWMGNRKDYIAAKARHVFGNVGVFDAMTGDAIWYTPNDFPAVNAAFIYVADVAGDSREEVIVCDSTYTGYKIRIYWNNQSNPNQPKPNKWKDPLYRRLKQNWSYYSPGSYTYGDYPIISSITVSDTTSTTVTITWQTDEPSDSQIEYGETSSYGSETTRGSTLVTDHSVQITGLIPGREYHFRVKSRNGYSKLGISSDNTFVTLGLAAPQITNVSVQNSIQLQLTWKPVENAVAYNIYRDTVAYFIPDKTGGSNRVDTNVSDENADLPDVQWSDRSDVIGNTSRNYFYVVTALNGSCESDSSNRVGEFDYQLITTDKTNFNEIALSLAVSGITNAQELMEAIPHCTSVAYWDASIQGYNQYVPLPGFEDTNFSVEPGYPYYVNVDTDTLFTLTGEIATPSFSLITTSSTNFNEVMVTLKKTYITKASELMADISHCTSVAYWDASIQGYNQYVPLPGFEDTNFSVEPGYPYYVNVDADVIWPEGGVPKRLMLIKSKQLVQMRKGSNAPHAVCGQILVKGDSLKLEGISFTAYITSRSEERLTNNSPGCMIDQRYWIVQCATFPSPWKAGEVLRVEFQGEKGQYLGAKEVELTYKPLDKANDIILSDSSGGVERLPSYYALYQNFPNPFNSETRIRYQLRESGKVTIRVYNILGEEICTLLSKEEEAGFHEIIWNGRNKKNHVVGSGIYLLHMEARTFVENRKMFLIQ